MAARHCIVVGGGHAAAQLAPALRQQGWAGDITLLGDEGLLPYQRPPLSKGYLTGGLTAEQLLIKGANAYEKARVHCRLGVRAERIDRAARQLVLAGGERLHYDALALAVGARPRALAVPGHDLDGVFGVRSIADLDRMRGFMAQHAPQRAVIVGGGYIGLETAAVLRKLGLAVTVLEAMPRLLHRVTTPEVSAFYQRVHAEEGVDVRCGEGVTALEGSGRVSAVRCASGERLPAELVVVGIGVVANTALAAEAGLATAQGIVVDAFARSSDPDIVAAGDCTEFHSALYDRTIRLESVPHAVAQASTAAATLCGQLQPYRALPWFWSDQYDLKLQMAGLSQGHDQTVVRGTLASGRSATVFYLQGGRLLALDCINRPKDFLAGKKLIESRQVLDPQRLADPACDLASLLEPKGIAP